MPPSGLCSISYSIYTSLQFPGNLLHPHTRMNPQTHPESDSQLPFGHPAAVSQHLILPKSFQLLIARH